MGKRDITDWTQKGGQQTLHSSGPAMTDKVRDTAGKAGLLMCAAAAILVLAKGVRDSDIWKATRDEVWEEPGEEAAQEETGEKEETA